MTRAQLERFREATRGLDYEVSIANSAGIFGAVPLGCHWVRPGLALYGASPFADCPADSLGLQPVMTFMSSVIAVRHVARGEAVGYGGRWVAPREAQIAIVAAGYGDGVHRSFANGAAVLVNDVGLGLRKGVGGFGLESGTPSLAAAQRVVDEIVAKGGRAAADCTDVANIARAGKVVEAAIRAFGTIDILVNNAGTVHDAWTYDLDDERFDAEFGSHVKGTMGTTQAAMKYWRENKRGGRII